MPLLLELSLAWPVNWSYYCWEWSEEIKQEEQHISQCPLHSQVQAFFLYCVLITFPPLRCSPLASLSPSRGLFHSFPFSLKPCHSCTSAVISALICDLASPFHEKSEGIRQHLNIYLNPVPVPFNLPFLALARASTGKLVCSPFFLFRDITPAIFSFLHHQFLSFYQMIPVGPQTWCCFS